MDAKNKGRIKRAAMATVAVAILILAGLALRPRPVPVETAQVDRGPLQVTVDGDGKTRVKERYVVAAPVTGRMARVTLRAGDRVDEATPITSIDPVEPPLLDVRTRAEAGSRVKLAEASLERSQASLGAAREQAEHAREELDRQGLLLSRGAAARAQYDEAKAAARTRQSELEAARFAVEVDRQQLAVARAALVMRGAPGGSGRVLVQSPIAGTVLRVVKEDAGPVTAGTALVELGDVAQLELVADLISTEALQVEPGFEALVEHWGGPPLAGRVRRIEPSGFTKISALGVEEQRVNVLIDLPGRAASSAKEPLPALGDGYHAEVRIVVWQQPNVLRVPVSALFRDHDEWAAFVVEHGRAKQRALRIGHRDSSFAEVLGGLEAGERVIVHPGDRVTENVAVDG